MWHMQDLTLCAEVLNVRTRSDATFVTTKLTLERIEDHKRILTAQQTDRYIV